MLSPSLVQILHQFVSWKFSVDILGKNTLKNSNTEFPNLTHLKFDK